MEIKFNIDIDKISKFFDKTSPWILLFCSVFAATMSNWQLAIAWAIAAGWNFAYLYAPRSGESTSKNSAEANEKEPE